MKYILALDQGTTSSRSIIFDRDGRGLRAGFVRVRLHERPVRFAGERVRPTLRLHVRLEVVRDTFSVVRLHVDLDEVRVVAAAAEVR